MGAPCGETDVESSENRFGGGSSRSLGILGRSRCGRGAKARKMGWCPKTMVCANKSYTARRAPFAASDRSVRSDALCYSFLLLVQIGEILGFHSQLHPASARLGQVKKLAWTMIKSLDLVSLLALVHEKGRSSSSEDAGPKSAPSIQIYTISSLYLGPPPIHILTSKEPQPTHVTTSPASPDLPRPGLVPHSARESRARQPCATAAASSTSAAP